MFPEILVSSLIITIIAKKIKDYYSSNYHRQTCVNDDAVQDISTNIISQPDTILKEEEILVVFYSDKNYMGNKKELIYKVYSKDEIDFQVNSMKIIIKRAHIIFFNGDSRMFSYTSHVPNTIEFIKSGKLWTHVQVTKF
jgi:hypothetical protein